MVHYTSPVDVFLILTRGDRVLLALRQGTPYADGLWNFPSGKLDDGETVETAMCREAHEEIGIKIGPGELASPMLLHYRSPEGQGRLGLFYALELDAARHGEPFNAEPHKCGGLKWVAADAEPAAAGELVPYTLEGWRLWRSGRGYAGAGW